METGGGRGPGAIWGRGENTHVRGGVVKDASYELRPLTQQTRGVWGSGGGAGRRVARGGRTLEMEWEL